MNKFKLLDTIALLNPVSVERLTWWNQIILKSESLLSGQVGTIVEVYEEGEEFHYLVDADTQGREYAMATLSADEFLVLQYELTVV
ncbi:MAG: DUF4926 domain-containing protein [Rhizonema sp. NSF051]|nr:DUF4926 domain-containing protein [Rhizonema sp. NSF051]